MAAARRQRKGRGALKKAIREARDEAKSSKITHVHLEISLSLLEKLNLPPSILKRAKEHEAHTIRLADAIHDSKYGRDSKGKTVVKIFEVAKTEIESQIRKFQAMNDTRNVERLRKWKEEIEKTITKARKFKPDGPARPIPVDILREVTDSHMHQLMELLGEKKFERYIKAMKRVGKMVIKGKF